MTEDLNQYGIYREKQDMEGPDPHAKHLIVGIGHKARQGKDWVAQYIHEELPEATKIYSLSDPIKQLISCLFNESEPSKRMLQAFGTEVGRAADANCWINLFFRNLQHDNPPIALLPGIRFLNEVNMILAHGGMLIEVQRLNADGTQYIAEDRDSQHCSETELDDFDWPIVLSARSGDVEALARGANRIVFKLRDWLRGKKLRGGDDKMYPNYPRAFSSG